MRKILCLIIIMLLSVFPAYASDAIDLSEVSTEELFSLLDEIKVELELRGEGSLYIGSINSGTYITGIDIAPGVYDIVSLSNGVAGAYTIAIFEDSSKLHDESYEPFEASMFADYPFHIRLEEGNVLLIDAVYTDLHIFRSEMIE